MTPPVLSHREWLTFCCWAGGMSLQQTATSLNIGLQSVKTYRSRIRRKMNTPDPHLTGRTPTHA